MSAIQKAKELVQYAYLDEIGMSDVMRKDAAVWAAIAQAEQLKRIADYIEGYCHVYLDPAIVNEVNERND